MQIHLRTSTMKTKQDNLSQTRPQRHIMQIRCVSRSGGERREGRCAGGGWVGVSKCVCRVDTMTVCCTIATHIHTRTHAHTHTHSYTSVYPIIARIFTSSACTVGTACAMALEGADAARRGLQEANSHKSRGEQVSKLDSWSCTRFTALPKNHY